MRLVGPVVVLALAFSACSAPPHTSSAHDHVATHSASLALSSDGRLLFVANPEADSVSVVDVGKRKLQREILLAPSPPAVDPGTGAYTPAVMPRDVALSPDGATLYVTGERSSRLYAVDVESAKVTGSVRVGSEPIGVVVSSDGKHAFVACSEDGSVVEVDTRALEVTASVDVPGEPWALGWSRDEKRLYATQFLGPGAAEISPATMKRVAAHAIADVAPRGDKRLAHGQARGLYDVAPRPGSSEMWVAHTLLGTDTAQPDLDFESTAFPAFSVLVAGAEQTFSTDAQDIPGIDGSISDVVSGPHAFAFTNDGRYLLMVDTNSEDVMIVDARTRLEIGLVRPLPGAMPDGIVLSPDGTRAYVDERISGDIAVLDLDESGAVLDASVDGAPIARLSKDPMPEQLRLGQHVFNSANSTEFPVTTDHWISCATCHMEGRSDAVTWLFAQGPRDTPSNAGGMLGTGFLFRTADRTQVQDYFQTVNVEQGGNFDPVAQKDLLDAIADYVNHAIPLPVPPTTDPSLVQKGKKVFADSGCGSCHSGPRFTDSGAGNPTLDLAGPLTLHDVGTCVKSGPFPDVAHDDIDGDPRTACGFDTPSLDGVASTPPYLHDGSAATLDDAVKRMPGAPDSADDRRALVEYLRSL